MKLQEQTETQMVDYGVRQRRRAEAAERRIADLEAEMAKYRKPLGYAVIVRESGPHALDSEIYETLEAARAECHEAREDGFDAEVVALVTP